MEKKILFFISIYLFFFHGLSFSQSTLPDCYKNLATQFFKYETTAQAFSMNQIDQSIWSTLVTQLQLKSQEAPRMIEDQAEQMRPNPLSPSMQPQVASQLLYNALYAIFHQVLTENNAMIFTNDVAIGEMFRHIWMAQLSTIKNCLGPAAVQKYLITE